MGLDEVKQQIIAEAKQEAKQIVSEAEKEAQAIKEKAHEEVSAYEKQAKARAEQLQASMERKLLAQARFDAQRLTLDARKEAIETVMSGAKSKLSKLSETERKKLLKRLLHQAKEEIDIETVWVNKQDKSLVDAKTVKEMDIAGGLIAQNKSGTISVNLSVEELLEARRNDLLVEVSEVLF